MKLLEIFGKSAKKGTSELDQLLDVIIKIESKRDSAKAALEAAREALQHGMAADIADGEDRGHENLTGRVMAAQEQANAAESLLKQSRAEVVGMIAANADKDRQRLAECEAEIAETRTAIDTRKIKIISEFAQAHGLSISWPSKTNAGTITIPSMSFDGSELLEVAAGVKAAPYRDQQADELAALYSEKSKLNVVAFSTPEQALAHLLMERRRK